LSCRLIIGIGSSTELTSMPRTTSNPLRRPRRSRWQIVKALLTSGWSIAGYIALGVTLLGAVVFFPRLSASSDATLDPSDPFATPFILRNDGYFSVYKVRAACSIDVTAGGTIKMVDVAMTSKDLKTPEIVADGTWEFMCPAGLSFKVPVSQSEIRIFISYSATLFPKPCTYKCFRYVTKSGKDNQLRWFSVADLSCNWPSTILTWTGQSKPNLPPELR
jgi:hypothetical protein